MLCSETSFGRYIQRMVLETYVYKPMFISFPLSVSRFICRMAIYLVVEQMSCSFGRMIAFSVLKNILL